MCLACGTTKVVADKRSSDCARLRRALVWIRPQLSWGVIQQQALATILDARHLTLLGIAIAILYRDHDPPHFHATYAEFEITVTIRDGQVTGQFPRRAQALVLEWLTLHRSALLADWDRAWRGEPLAPIPPLDRLRWGGQPC
jgi:hypothetical protein